MPGKLKTPSVVTPDENSSCSEAGCRRLLSLVRLAKFGSKKKNHCVHLFHGTDDRFFHKINKNMPCAYGPKLYNKSDDCLKISEM